MSKNILYVLTALLTFQSASAYFFLESSNRIKEAIASNCLERLEYQFQCLEEEGVVFTQDMLETYRQFSLQQIAELEDLKRQATEPYKLADLSNRVSEVAFFSGITGALGCALVSKMISLPDPASFMLSLPDAASLHERNINMSKVWEMMALFVISAVGVQCMYENVHAKLNNPLWIQDRLNEQEKIYKFLQQKLFYVKCLCQAA